MIEMWIVHFESEGCEVHFLLFRDIKMFITPFNDKISVDWNRTRIPNLIYMLIIKKPLTLKYKRIYSEKKKKMKRISFLKKNLQNERIDPIYRYARVSTAAAHNSFPRRKELLD